MKAGNNELSNASKKAQIALEKLLQREVDNPITLVSPRNNPRPLVSDVFDTSKSCLYKYTRKCVDSYLPNYNRRLFGNARLSGRHCLDPFDCQHRRRADLDPTMTKDDNDKSTHVSAADAAAAESMRTRLSSRSNKEFSSMTSGDVEAETLLQNINLHRLCRQMMQSRSIETKLLFEMMDTDNDGFLSRFEVEKVLRMFGVAVPHADFDMILQSQDKDNSGTIDEQEFANMIEEKMYEIGFNQSIRESFDMLDLDGDGSIGIGELMYAVSVAGVGSITRDEIEIMIEEVDDDFDGQIGLREFTRIVKGDL